mmetsp:Transcript_53603/g.89095  ORF Transcript_53603/g.89095 Transcript_53603/m.89095 type:complete len:991 (+) Transcript_53603:230-3202(+)
MERATESKECPAKPVNLEGYLFVTSGGLFSKWKRRWFSQKGYSIHWFDIPPPTSSKPVGSFCILDVSLKKERRRRIRVRLKEGKVILLLAPDKAEHDWWFSNMIQWQRHYRKVAADITDLSELADLWISGSPTSSEGSPKKAPLRGGEKTTTKKSDLKSDRVKLVTRERSKSGRKHELTVVTDCAVENSADYWLHSIRLDPGPQTLSCLEQEVVTRDVTWLSRFVALEGPSILVVTHLSREVGKFKTMFDLAAMSMCLRVLQAFVTNPLWLEGVICSQNAHALKGVALGLSSSSLALSSFVLDMFAGLCLFSPQGHRMCVLAMDSFQIIFHERFRFLRLVQFLHQVDDFSYKCSVLSFINALVSGTDDTLTQRSIASDFAALDLLSTIKSLGVQDCYRSLFGLLTLFADRPIDPVVRSELKQPRLSVFDSFGLDGDQQQKLLTRILDAFTSSLQDPPYLSAALLHCKEDLSSTSLSSPHCDTPLSSPSAASSDASSIPPITFFHHVAASSPKNSISIQTQTTIDSSGTAPLKATSELPAFLLRELRPTLKVPDYQSFASPSLSFSTSSSSSSAFQRGLGPPPPMIQIKLPEYSAIGSLNGGLVPPPPPPIGGKGLPVPEWKGPRPNCALRPVFWTKIPPRLVSSTVWSSTNFDDVPELNMAELEATFSAKPAALDLSLVQRTDQPIQKRLLENTRARNIEITIRRRDTAAMIKAISNVDMSALTREDIQAISSCLPNKDESQALRAFGGSEDHLNRAEQFAIQLLSIPSVEAKLTTIGLSLSLKEHAESIKEEFAVLSKSACALKESSSFRKLLQIVLYIGNVMNCGTQRGNAYGFRIDTLTKLADLKSTDGKTTLLNFIVKFTLAKAPCLVDDTLKEFQDFDRACRVCITERLAELKEMRGSLHSVQEHVCREMHDSLKAELDALDSAAQLGLKDFSDCALYLGEDPTLVDPADVFRIVYSFVWAFEAARQEALHTSRKRPSGRSGSSR